MVLRLLITGFTVCAALSLLLLGLSAGVRAEESSEKEKLGTVIGIDLGTTCGTTM